MESYLAIFTDIDGTLLNSEERIGGKTIMSLKRWIKNGRRLILTSSRPQRGIAPILQRYNLSASMIALGGSLIYDEKGKLIFEEGMSKEEAFSVLSFLEEKKLDVVWNVYTKSSWISSDRNNERVKKEEQIIEASSDETTFDSIPKEEKIGKILCMGSPDVILQSERILKTKFPNLNISRSHSTLLEINPSFINKAVAVKKFCQYYQIPLEETIGFGDNYNDLPFLDVVGLPILMGNAPEEILATYPHHTLNHNEDGIAFALDALLKE